jgi:hypothetical protein
LIYVGHFVTFTAIVPLILVNAADLVRTLFGIPYFGLDELQLVNIIDAPLSLA